MPEHLSQDQIHALLDHELEPFELQALEAHLAACADCQGELAAAMSLFETIGGLPDERLAVDLAPGVLAAIQPAPHWLRSLAFGELLVALAVGIGLLLGVGGDTVSLRVTEAAQRIAPTLDAALQALVAAANNAVPDPTSFQIDLGMPAVWSLVIAAMVAWALSNGLVLRRVSRSDRA